MTTSTSKQTTQDKRLTDGPDWTFELLQVYLDQIVGWRNITGLILIPIR